MEAAAIAKRAGAVISYDPNYRASLWKDEKTAVEGMKSAIPLADVMKVSDEELARRRANWTPKTKEVSGYLKRYAALVTSADKGAILKGN